jgi:general stress protein 26
MNEKMRSILEQNSLCVLATISADKPHCSLMSYILDETRTKFLMTTLKDSRKFRNVVANPNVSILVDTRTTCQNNGEDLQALTIWGHCSLIVEDRERLRLLEILATRHPRLQELVERPDAQVLCIQIESILLLDGVLEGRFEKLQP